MLTRLEIRNFQSLKKVDLDLGDFTVIVGPSSSGKSALMRACRAVASNVRGSSFITRGQKLAAITARTDTHTVTLERSEQSGTYRLADAQGTELTFTKLNGGVPEHVTRALRIEPVISNGTSVNFAGQFDRPYLLDDSGANVARVLGELTNVSTIFEAVRAANKVRLNASSTLKTRKNDLVDLRGRLVGFQGLGDRLKALEVAEGLAEQARERTAVILRLERALMQLNLAETALSRAEALPVVPDPAPLNNALNAYLDLQAKMNGLAAKEERATKAGWEVGTREQELAELEAELAEVLRHSGVCPTCGQPVKPAEPPHVGDA